MTKKAIVVGASSGIGAEIAKELIKAGYSVAVLARRKENLVELFGSTNTSKIYVHDVTHFSEIPSLFQQITQDVGEIDEVYFATGIMEKVSIDEFNTEKDLSMMNTNTLGAIAWLNEAARYFQSKGKGKIIAISSIAGDRGRVGNPVYNTSKAALNTYMEALRNRLARKGINVLNVKPGFIDTDMTKGMPGLFWLITANEAAKIIIKAAQKNKEEIYVPARWGLVAFVIKSIPSFIFKKLNV
jgi:short-subunit dehydrogenase